MARFGIVALFVLALCSCVTVRYHAAGARRAYAATGPRQSVSAAELPPDGAAGFVKTPLDGLRFWRKVMTPAVAAKYRARGGRTKCNVFVGDTLEKYFGPEVFARVFPDGVKAPDVMCREWQSNPNLARLGPDEAGLERIQELADEGYVILFAYINAKGPSHLAFVGHSRLVMFTVPKIKKLEGKTIGALEPEWLPVVVQAGAYSGVTSAAYASNGWLSSEVHHFESGIVRFYLVRA